ncbi:MAG: porin family protein [Sphingomicrobium sp.]
MAIVLALALAAQSPPPSDPCTGQDNCVTTGAAQLFAVADRMFAAGDGVGAEQLLTALLQDKVAEVRAEARFRIAAVREQRGDLAGAAQSLRDLLAEQPDAQRARLELARLLSRLGDAKAAKAELATAERAGLPPEVEQTVRQFSTALAPPRRRGLSIELASGLDSNINRATASQFVDTVIAPFELDPDARRRSGLGLSTSLQGWSQNRVGPVDLMSRATMRAELFDKSRFNDFQLSADSGPQWQGKWGRLRPSLTVERRWFGGHGYELGYGGQLGWQTALGTRSVVEVGASHIHQSIDRNRFQSGWRSNLNLSLSRSLGRSSTVRGTVRWAALDARAKPESLHQWGVDGLVATRAGSVTLFGEAGLTKTRGLAPLFLFGKARRDHRIDLSAGAVFSTLSLGGFAPLVRVSHSRSSANIVLYDYKRTRLDIGFTHNF